MTSETAEKEKAAAASTSPADIIMTKTKIFAENFEKLAKPAFEFLVVLLPYVIKFGKKVNEWWQKADDHVIKAIIGFAFCFFGGMYPTLFAGVQAAEQGGRVLLIESIKDLSEEATRIIEESKKDDDAKDTPSSDNLEEYAKHKTLFVLEKMNPQKVNTALSNLYSVWFAVISVLVVQFAQTIQMANSIAEFLAKPAKTYVKPVLHEMIPKEYQQWVPVLLLWATKAVGVSIAWTFVSVRTAFTSALIGGMMIARSGLIALKQRGIDVEAMVTPEQREFVDDNISYVFAFLGVLFQMKFWFSPPFPLNILLFPFQLCEWALRWGVMKASGSL